MSTESEAAKRVSCFVEIFINSLNNKYVENEEDSDDVDIRLSFTRLVCINLPAEIARYSHNLLPFEFARRGIHMTLRQGSGQSRGDKDDSGVWNLSSLRFGKIDSYYLPEPEKCFCLPLPCDDASSDVVRVRPGTVMNAFEFPYEAGKEVSMCFTHKRCKYCLSIDDDQWIARLERRGVGCGFVNGDIREDVILCSSRTDLVHKFNKGGFIYDTEEYGVSYISEVGGEGDWNTYMDMPLVNGMETHYINDNELGRNAYLLIVASKEKPILVFDNESQIYSDTHPSDIWEMSFDQSPEWALCTNGVAPKGSPPEHDADVTA